MKKLIRFAVAAALVGGFFTPAFSQGAGQLGSGQVWGNSGASQAPAAPTNISPLLDRVFGSTRGSILARGASAWAIVPPGTTAFPFVSNGAGADAAYQKLTGAGVETGTITSGLLANTAVTAASYGSSTQCVAFAVNAQGQITSASAATCVPAIGSVTGLGTGIATFLATPSSANLRAALTDEVGTGSAYFVGGALGTPASGVGTNLTGTASGLTAGSVTTNANLTGPVTSVGNATSVPNNAITNAMAAQMAAYTIKGNATGSTANASDIDIAALTTKASPATGDYLVISDQSASGAIKKATVSSVSAAGSVSSIAGLTGAFTLSGGILNSANDIRLAREILAASRTYYVRTNGDDTACTGLTNAAYVSGSYPQNCGWKSLQKAADFIAASLDVPYGITVTVQIGAGTYTAGLSMLSQHFTGGGTVIFVGDTTTPSNVVVSSSGTCFQFTYPTEIWIRGIKIACGGNSGIYVSGGAVLHLDSNMDYGVVSSVAHIWANSGGRIYITGTGYSISGNAARHYAISNGGQIEINIVGTITCSGATAFSAAFVYAASLGVFTMAGTAPSFTSCGSVTGQRYSVQQNSLIDTAGQGATYFPGSTAGAPATGGLYN